MWTVTLGGVLDVLMHPVAGTIRATRRWPASTCHLRSFVALVLLGAISTAGCLVYFRAVGVEVVFTVAQIEVAYILPLLLGCGFAGAMVLVGGTFVRVVASNEWERAIDENQYVRLMAAAMWALVPFVVAAVALGIGLGELLGRPRIVLWVLPVTVAVSFAGLTLAVVRSVYRNETGEPVCDRCGYLLKHLVTPRCPECGEPFPPEWLSGQPPQPSPAEGMT